MKKKVLSLFLLCVLMISSVITVQAEETGLQANDSNVMLVIDGSGSLTNSGGTDVNGLRYEAIDLFLGLLPNKGSSVGAIVFDDSKTMPLNTGITAINSTEDKRTLSDKIRKTQAGGDTDIGSALQTALTGLTANAATSDLPNCILLFSDGETYLTNDADLKQSLQKKEDALQTAAKLGIPIHSICLNTNNSANTSEVKKIAEATGGEYMEINDASDLTSVFEKFYSIIFKEPGDDEEGEIPSSGVFSRKFQVPSIGVEEVNIVIRIPKNTPTVSLIRPDGIALTDTEIKAISTIGSNYYLIKLSDPDVGVWELQVKGDPGTKISLNWIYNTELGADIECSSGTDNIPLNSNVTIKGYLLNSNGRVTSEASYGEYSATLLMTNAATGEETAIGMTADGASFTTDVTLNDYATYYVSLRLTCDKIERTSQSIVLNVGNSAPIASPSVVRKSVKLTPFSSGEVTFNLNDYIKDAEDSTLSYTLGYYSYDNGDVTLDDSTLKINAKDTKEGEVTVTATDSQGAACEVTFKVTTTDLTFLFILIPVILVLIIAIVLISRKNRGKKWVCNFTITVESFDNTNGNRSQPFAQSGFTYKIPLAFFQIGDCGINGEFVATAPAKGQKFSKCEFVSKQPFITDAGMTTNRISLDYGMQLNLYAPAAPDDPSYMQRGIHIIIDNDQMGFGDNFF